MKLLTSVLLFSSISESEARNIPTGGKCTKDVYNGICLKTDCCGYAIPVYGGLAERRCNTRDSTTWKSDSGEKYTFTCPIQIVAIDERKKIAGAGSAFIFASISATMLATSYNLL